MKVYIVEDLMIEALKDLSFEYIKNDKKEVYKCEGLEVDVKTRELIPVSKYNPIIILTLYNLNMIVVK